MSFTINPISGHGDTIVSVSATPNTNPYIVEGTYRATIGNGQYAEFRVVQKAYNTITFNPSTVYSDFDGDTQTVTVTANGDWTIVSYPDWVTISPISGHSGTTQITITTDPNSGGLRDGNITFRMGDEPYSNEFELPITQEAWVEPTLTGITFGTVAWAVDVPSRGGVANKDNCVYTVIGQYDRGSDRDITDLVTVSGYANVPPTQYTERRPVGYLTLTARYGMFSASTQVTMYQLPYYSLPYLRFVSNVSGELRITMSWPAQELNVDYSRDEHTWYAVDYRSIQMNPNEPLYLRGYNPNGWFRGSYEEITSYGQVSFTVDNESDRTNAELYVDGDMMGLLNKGGQYTITTIPCEGCFKHFFQLIGNYLVTAPEISAVGLAKGCYYAMFADCMKLTNCPQLPAIALADWCYSNMFENCSSLTTAPALPATALTEGCYFCMFEFCSSLTTAPILPASILQDSCYYSMFYRCTSINFVKCLATNINYSDHTINWLSGAPANGTFVKAVGVNWPSGASGIPNNWTVIEE